MRSKRLEALAETKSISRQEADDAVASRQVAAANLDVARKQLELLLAGSREEDVAQALAQYNQAKASLTIREQNLKDAVLYAPGNGVVRNRILEKGDMASPQKPVYNISLNHTKWVRAYLTESQLGKVKPGFSATVRNDSFPDTGFKGTVGFISSVAEFTPKTWKRRISERHWSMKCASLWTIRTTGCAWEPPPPSPSPWTRTPEHRPRNSPGHDHGIPAPD